VDDDSDDRNMFCWAIRKIDPGIQCIEIENAEKAIEFLRLSDIFPDFIFMDINMPRINGYECVQEIHGFPNLKNTQIIMYSSSFNPRDQVEFGVLGLKYLSKTSDIHELVDSIKKMIQSN